MSLYLNGFLNTVELADEGYYLDDNGNQVRVSRSGRLCKGCFFNLLLGTMSGGLMVQNTVRYSCLAIVESDNRYKHNLPLDGLLNYGGLVASRIAQISNGVILGLTVDLGIYRDDEMYKNLGNSNNSLLLGVTRKTETRVIDDNTREVILTYPGEYYFKVPFLGENVGNLADQVVFSYSDLIDTLENRNILFKGYVSYRFGYLKFEDNDTKNNIVGVLSDVIFINKVLNNNNSFIPSLQNVDSGRGFLVKGSLNFGESDLIISEKFI